MTVMHQIVFIYLYEDISYIFVTYIKGFRILHGLVEVLALLRLLVFGGVWLRTFRDLCIAPVFQGSYSSKHSVTLEDRTDGCRATNLSRVKFQRSEVLTYIKLWDLK